MRKGTRRRWNEYEILPGGHACIRMAWGLSALVDLADVPVCQRYFWRPRIISGLAYAVARTPDSRTSLYLHRLLCKAGPKVDHRNGDTLDNRRQNLRSVSNAQNAWNSRKQRNNTSGFKGAWFSRKGRCWVASLMAHGRQYSRHGFQTAEEAARAYDEMAREHHGEYACLNFPRDGERSVH